MAKQRLLGHYPTSQFDFKAASDHEYERFAAFADTMRRERLPDDPLVSFEEFEQNWKNTPDFVELEGFLVWDEGQNNVIAFYSTWIEHTGDNEHLCEFNIQVLPQYRRQGIARQLLSWVIDFARSHDRRLLRCTTYGTVPAGSAFMERLGAERGLESHINQLKISERNHAWIEKWTQAGEDLSSRFELGLWEGPTPEEHLLDLAELVEMIFRDAPHGQLDEEPKKMSPEILRQIDQYRADAKMNWWVMYVRDRSNGRFAGWTEVVWSTHRPTIVEQSGTGVYPEYRNQGLGHWLKAAMMQKLLRDQPQMKMIRTGNADSNEAMVKINQEMGYKPYTTWVFWQVERAQMEAYLYGKSPEVADKTQM